MGDDIVLLTTQYGGHSGLGAARGLRHGEPAPADQHHGRLVGEHTGGHGRGDLADAVARDRADTARQPRETGRALDALAEQRVGGDQTGGHQQRLGHRGVADLLLVGLGAVVDEVQPGHGRPPRQTFGDAGQVEPGSEEAGLLSALAGSDEYEHSHTLLWTVRLAREDKDEEPSGELWRSNKRSGQYVRVGETAQDQGYAQSKRRPDVGR